MRRRTGCIRSRPSWTQRCEKRAAAAGLGLRGEPAAARKASLPSCLRSSAPASCCTLSDREGRQHEKNRHSIFAAGGGWLRFRAGPERTPAGLPHGCLEEDQAAGAGRVYDRGGPQQGISPRFFAPGPWRRRGGEPTDDKVGGTARLLPGEHALHEPRGKADR